MSDNNSIRRTAVSIAVAAALAGSFQSAMAQDQDDGRVIDEITVTASKRAAGIQDVSIAVTALTGEQMRLGGIEDITRLEHLVPGMRMGQSGNEARLAFRGTRTNNVGTEAEQVVGIFEDGVYVPTTTQALGAYIDVKRIEVLRGPQGTLYGRNTFGGTINIITNQPEFDGMTGKVEALYGEYNRTRLEGVVNIPFSDTFALRVAAMNDQHDGYIENYYEAGTGDDLSDRDMTFVRLSARWAPTDKLDMTLRHTFSDLDSNGNAQWGYQIIGSYVGDEYFDGLNNDAPPNASDDYDRGPWEVRRDLKSTSIHETSSTTLNVNWDLGAVALNVIGNFTNYEGEQISDFDYSDGGDPLNSGFAGWTNDQDTVSFEATLSSNGDGLFDWMVGYYVFDMEATWTWLEVVDGVKGVTHWDAQSPYKSDSSALFANATFPIGDRVRLVAGIRQQEDGKQTRDDLDWSVFPPVNADGTGRQQDWSKTLYKAGLEFDLNDDMLTYGTISTGYRAGGFNPVSDGIPNSYDPEEVTAYEIGLKMTLADGTAVLNLAAFHNEYTEMQAQAFIDLGGSAISEYASNGGEVTADGLEAELFWRPTDQLNISANVAFLDAEFGEYNGGTLNGFSDFDGRQDPSDPVAGFSLRGWEPTLSPDLTFGAQVGYDIEFSGGSVLTPFVQTSYSSDYYATDYNLEGGKQDAYTKTDVRLIWRSASQNLEVQGFVLNVEDEAVMMRIATYNPNATTTGLQTHWGNPRTWGVSGTYFFE
jgi:outer membrane receptor protein involved in Fe transport